MSFAKSFCAVLLCAVVVLILSVPGAAGEDGRVPGAGLGVFSDVGRGFAVQGFWGRPVN